MAKNKLYYLNIHKNAGRLIQNKVINRISPSLDGIILETKNSGWMGVDENTFIISAFRNPVLRTVSHFCDYKKNILKDDSSPTVKEFTKWFDDHNKNLINYQLKNLFYTSPSDNNFLLDEEFGNLELPSKLSDIKSRLRRIDALVRVENLRDETLYRIGAKALKSFEKDWIPSNIPHIPTNKNIISKKLALSLPPDITTYLEDLNSIEMDIYNTDSLFNKFTTWEKTIL